MSKIFVILHYLSKDSLITFIISNRSHVPKYADRKNNGEISIAKPPAYEALAEAYESDDELQKLLGSTIALRLKKLTIPGTTVSIYCDTSTSNPRSYVPGPLRLHLFQSVHDLSHPGTKVTVKIVAERFVWAGMQKDCRNWARAYQSCQRCKVSRHTFTPLGDFTLPAASFLHIHKPALY
jgi:hypothetical protein